MLRCVVDNILQEFITLFPTRFRAYKNAAPPQTKIPVKRTLRDWCLYSSFVHGIDHLPSVKSRMASQVSFLECPDSLSGVSHGRSIQGCCIMHKDLITRCLLTYVYASHVSRGRILGRNWDKILKSFPPCYSQPPLLLIIPPPHRAKVV
jgi:hypothetical protein